MKPFHFPLMYMYKILELKNFLAGIVEEVLILES